MCLYRRWWEQPTLDIMGIKTGQVAAEGGGRHGGENKSRRKIERRVGADDGGRMIW